MEFTLKIPEDLQKGLKTTPVVKLDENSASELLEALLKFAWRLNQFSWPVWKTLSPDSEFRPKEDFSQVVSRYLNSGNGSAEELNQNLERTHRLIVGLLTSILGRDRPANSGSSGGIHNYARELSARLSPDAIKSSAEYEQKWYESLDRACWHFYQERANQLTEGAIEEGLKEAIAADATFWIQFAPTTNPSSLCQT